jgi:hypothetical protein
MATSPKRVNMVAATNLRNALLNIPMGVSVNGAAAAVAVNGGYRGTSWRKPHAGPVGAVDYSCGNFALTGGTNAFFGPGLHDFGTVLGAMVDPNLPGTGHHVCYNSGPPAMADGALLDPITGTAHVYGGAYRYLNGAVPPVADDLAPIYQDIPALFTNNAQMPPAVGGVAYALTNAEWTRLGALRTAALNAGIPWKKVGVAGPAYRTQDPDSTWGDGLRNLNTNPPTPFAPLNANEEAVLRNQGPNHNSAAMRFFHKLMKRVAELSGWKIKDYNWNPRTIGGGLADAVGIAVTSISPWGADHWGFVVTNAAMPNPAGAGAPINMRDAFFQQVAGNQGRLNCYGARLWDEGRPMTVLWVKRAPQAVINEITNHYH